MSVVSNTGPLIALAKADQLNLLASLYSVIQITSVVQRELLAKTGPEADRLDVALSSFIKISDYPDAPVEVQAATQSLDPGERSAVALAHHLKLPLLIDDRLGRIAARQLSLSVTGTIGILLQAKRDGFLAQVKPTLEQLRENGYWLSDEIVQAALKLADE